MITIECPWCEAPAEVESAIRELRCPQCAVVVEIAPDTGERSVAAAA